MSLDFAWDQIVADCGTFTYHHYEICWLKGPSSSPPGVPGTPAAADECIQVGPPSTTTKSYLVHRADRAWDAAIFACDDEDCTDWYGEEGAETVTYDTDDDTVTEAEQWLLTSIYDEDDTDCVVDESEHANCSTSLIYPTGWTTYAGYLALWYSTADHEIFYQRAPSSSWTDWNTASWTTATLVSVKTTTSSGRYNDPSHPWAVPVDDGNKYIRMFYNVVDSTTGGTEVEYIDSVDEEGADFELECVSGSCSVDGQSCSVGGLCDWDNDYGDAGVPVVAVCSDSTSSCDYLANAAHGRLLWDYVGGGWAIDFGADTPMMMFTGAPDGTSCTRPGDIRDDIYLAQWSYSSSAWGVFTDGGSPDCPEEEAIDVHDPAMIPLPGGEFKRYVAYDDGGNRYILVKYWNGSSWEDQSAVEIVFDDGSDTPLTGTCIGNVDTLVYKNGATTYEGMFMHVSSGTGCPDNCGIIYAEHVN